MATNCPTHAVIYGFQFRVGLYTYKGNIKDEDNVQFRPLAWYSRNQAMYALSTAKYDYIAVEAAIQTVQALESMMA